jgi:hypothetical protein
MFTPTNGNGASYSRCVSGASLAQLVRRLSPAQRAILAAAIVEGRITLVDLTTKAIAELCRISEPYVYAALRCTPEQREAIHFGDRPLVQPRPRPVSPAVDWWRLNEDALLAAINGLELSTAVEVEHAN